MRISESCAKCLYDRQKNKTDNEAYLSEIRELLDNRKETDTSPYMVYLFNEVHERYFGAGADYKDIKKSYNDLVLGMEDRLRKEIEGSTDPLAKALIMARIGNYIDFGAMNHVDEDEFLSFLNECRKGQAFLLVCDNCGEIVLDKLMLEQLKKRFPHLTLKALVRGKDVLNDATEEDATYTGLAGMAEIVSNGEAIAGIIYEMMPEEARKALNDADVILAKGQGNYESMSGQGWHVFYEFLCKCDLFTSRFNVPRLTGMFVEEILR